MKEEEVCSRFKSILEEAGWVVYPETSGWDMLCIGPEGVQIGVEAKARANVVVLYQALRNDVYPGRDTKGPDFHAVLVPKAGIEFKSIATSLKLLCFDLSYIDEREVSKQHFIMHLNSLSYEDPRCWCHRCHCWVPPVNVDLPAGVPSPERITPWKVAAVRLSLRLNVKGYVTTRDFEEFGLRLTPFWRQRLWSDGKVSAPKRTGAGTVTLTRYVKSGKEMPDDMYPDIAKGLTTKAA